MRLMRRLRDGKIAVYDLGCVESGRWEEVVEAAPEPQKPPPAPRPPRAPMPPRPPRPLVRKTTGQQVVALFAPAQTETQKGSV